MDPLHTERVGGRRRSAACSRVAHDSKLGGGTQCRLESKACSHWYELSDCWCYHLVTITTWTEHPSRLTVIPTRTYGVCVCVCVCAFASVIVSIPPCYTWQCHPSWSLDWLFKQTQTHTRSAQRWPTWAHTQCSWVLWMHACGDPVWLHNLALNRFVSFCFLLCC